MLAQGAAASPAWWAKVADAKPAMLARWLELGEKRLLRLTYLVHME